MNEIRIGVEQQGHRAASLQVEREAFGSDDEAEIMVAVRDLEGSFALVALDGDTVIGHVQMSRAWIGDLDVLTLGPIGVAPTRQGEGVGSALVRAALEAAAERGEAIVILLGAPTFYGRFGFRPASEWGLSNPYAGVELGDFVIQESDFQIAVTDGHQVQLSGTVRWHPSFGEVG